MARLSNLNQLKVGVVYYHKLHGRCKLSFEKQEDVWFDSDNSFYITPLNKPGYCLWADLKSLEKIHKN